MIPTMMAVDSDIGLQAVFTSQLECGINHIERRFDRWKLEQMPKIFDLNEKAEKLPSPIARLFQLGREKSFVTYEDILQCVPEPESDLDLVDRIFATLICAGIPFGEDCNHLEDIGDEIIKELDLPCN